MRTRALCFLVAFCVAAPSSAQTLIDATSPEAILDVVRGYGGGTLEKAGDGDPMIRGRINGDAYVLYFYGCKEGAECRSVQFSAAWENPGQVGLAEVNDWNARKRFSKVFLDDENDPVLEMDVNLDFGVTRQNFDDWVDYWQVSLQTFTQEVLKE
jgi:hypothetical protein